jgi:hypothetical protein
VLRLGSTGKDSEAAIMGKRCAEVACFNVHANVRAAANDRDGLEHLCRYLARPPIANDRWQELPDGRLALRFKQAWRDGTTHIVYSPHELIEKLIPLIPPPRRHVVRYSGVISSHSSLRSQVVPVPVVPTPEEDDKPSRPLSHYISWSQLLKRTFEIDTVCQKSKAPLRLIALIKSEDIAKKILTAMHLPVDIPQLRPARPPPQKAGGGDDWLN